MWYPVFLNCVAHRWDLCYRKKLAKLRFANQLDEFTMKTLQNYHRLFTGLEKWVLLKLYVTFSFVVIPDR